MSTVPTAGIRYLTLEISDGTRTRSFPCTELSVPSPTDPETVEVFAEGTLHSVLRGNDVISDFSFSVPYGAFIDPSSPTIDEILGGTGLGAAWTALNDSISAVRVDSSYRCLRFTARLDTRKLGGTVTTRTWIGYARRAATIQRADPIVATYTGRVYGTITDAQVG